MTAALEILRVFLKLGLSSFGGPAAHLGYFREELVVRRRWLEDAAFSDLVALCQFLPGPGSSQLGFSVGLMRGGYLGALAAWTGFTLPSAAAMVLFAFGVQGISGTIGAGILYGLKLVAVAIIAQAVVGMSRVLCPDLRRASIAAVAVVIVLSSATSITQILAILWGALAGLWLCRTSAPAPTVAFTMPLSHRTALVALGLFMALLVAPALLRGAGIPTDAALFYAFYRSGALVFGGGHVLLPLLRDAFVTPGWVSDDTFLAGYGAAQALPGPLFSFGAYLGAVAGIPPRGLAGAAIGLAGIFLPGLLILIAALPFWQVLRTRPAARAFIGGINAAVVGILAAALYSPVWVSSVKRPADAAAAAAGFLLLTVWRVQPIIVVFLGALAGIGLTLL